jgi:hypothetical protein
MKNTARNNNNTQNIKIKNGLDIGYLLILIQSLLFIFLFPNIDYPDAIFQLQRVFVGIPDDTSFYIKLINSYKEIIEVFLGVHFDINLIRSGSLQYFSLDNYMIYQKGNYLLVSVLQIFNILLMFLSIFIFNIVVSKDTRISVENKNIILKANILYYLYPAVSYLMVGITSDFFNYLYQPFFIYFLYSKRHLVNISLILLIFVFVDEGIGINLFFLILYFFNKYILTSNVKNKKWKILTLNSILPLIFLILGKFIFSIFDSNYSIFTTAEYVQSNHGDYLTKIINFVLSSFTLWGVGNYVTIPIFYLIFIFFVLKIIKKSVVDNGETQNIFLYLITSIATIGSVISVFPPYSHIRFFLFFIFILILGYLFYFKNNYHPKVRNFLLIASLLFFHNVFLILFYSIKIFVFL